MKQSSLTMKLPNILIPFAAMIALLAPTVTANDEAAKALEKKAIGYWAPDGDAMLELFTKEKDMKKEDAQAAINESKKITMLGGMAPFILKRISEDEFRKRNADLPGEKVGP